MVALELLMKELDFMLAKNEKFHIDSLKCKKKSAFFKVVNSQLKINNSQSV